MLRTTFDIRYLEIAFLKSVMLVSLINLIRENNKIYIYIYTIQFKKKNIVSITGYTLLIFKAQQ